LAAFHKYADGTAARKVFQRPADYYGLQSSGNRECLGNYFLLKNTAWFAAQHYVNILPVKH